MRWPNKIDTRRRWERRENNREWILPNSTSSSTKQKNKWFSWENDMKLLCSIAMIGMNAFITIDPIVFFNFISDNYTLQYWYTLPQHYWSNFIWQGKAFEFVIRLFIVYFRGIQLIERNEEVCIFYEKVNIQGNRKFAVIVWGSLVTPFTINELHTTTHLVL